MEDDNMMSCYSDGYDTDGAFLDEENTESDYDPLQEKEDGEDNHSDYAFSRMNYRVLWELDISQRINDAIKEVLSVSSLSRDEASLLLIHFNWSVSKVIDQWFDNECLVREEVGLLEKSLSVVRTDESDENVSCGICFESYPFQECVSALCGHLYCKSCWCGYISTSINEDGLGCLKLRCPEPSCKAAVTLDMMESLVSEEGKKKLSEFLIRSYIEENRKTKWCPNPGCEYVIEIQSSGDDSVSFDVTCRCSNSFCWNCNEECHRPLGCEMVKMWIEKNSSESENVNYILSYCKPCPNCRRPIEKNGGCMVIRCRACHHSFCWLCLASMQNHVKCNSYAYQIWGIKRKEMAMQSLEKYTHYFERWDANRKSKLQALSDLKQVKSVQFKRLGEIQGVPEAQLGFITKAWLQIVECRRVLEWSYAYGYFMPEHETEKKLFFEHLQGVAESTLEKLHNLAEKGLGRFLIDTSLSEDFLTFRIKLEQLTAVTGSYFENLVRALENGLSDIASPEKASGSNSSSKDEDQEIWICDHCTHANLRIFTKCQMCISSYEGYEHVDNS